jgi:small ligand-binding sensory domain FIST
MATKAGVGYSVCRNPVDAGKEAAEKALKQSGISRPDHVFVFATVGYDQVVLLTSIREATSFAPLSGCSGEGIITQEAVNESNFCVAVMVVCSTEINFNHAFAIMSEQDSGLAGERLATSLKSGLMTDSFACLLFPDGLTFNYDLFLQLFVKELGMSSPLPIYGGMSADNGIAGQTFQYFNDQVLTNAMVGVVLSGAGKVVGGVTHGCVPVGIKHTITRSEGNVIYEIDGVPALKSLEAYLPDDWRTNWNCVAQNLCIGFKTPEKIQPEYGDMIIRYMMGMDELTGAVKIQSEVQNNRDLWIVRRDKELIKDGVQLLKRRLVSELAGRKPKFVLHFDCIGRGKCVFRDQERAEIIKSMQEELGEDVPWIGFYAYGEIAPIMKYNTNHNFTAVLAAITTDGAGCHD